MFINSDITINGVFLKEGEEVTFEVVDGVKGKQAANVVRG